MYRINVRRVMISALFRRSAGSCYYFVSPGGLPKWEYKRLWDYGKELLQGPLQEGKIMELLRADMMPVSLYMRSLGVWDAYTFHGNSTQEWETALRSLEDHIREEPVLENPKSYSTLEEVLASGDALPNQYILVGGVPYYVTEGRTRSSSMRELVLTGEDEAYVHCDSWERGERKFFDLYTVHIQSDGTVRARGEHLKYVIDSVAKSVVRAVTALLASHRILGEDIPDGYPLKFNKWSVVEASMDKDERDWIELS